MQTCSLNLNQNLKGTMILTGIVFAKRIGHVQCCVFTATSETRC